MTGDCKYVTFDAGGASRSPVTCLVFPAFLEHKGVATAMRHLLGPPISAGFICFSDGVPTAYGESLSLGLKSSSVADTLLLKRLFS